MFGKRELELTEHSNLICETTGMDDQNSDVLETGIVTPQRLRTIEMLWMIVERPVPQHAATIDFNMIEGIACR